MHIAPKTTLIAAALTLALASVGIAAPASAAESTASPGSISQAEWQAIDAGIDDQTGVFDGEVAARAGADEAVIDDFATGWVATGRTAVSANVDVPEARQMATALAETRCAGKSRWDYTGLQVNVYVNSCSTQTLLGVIAAGGGVAGAAAVLTSATGVGPAVAGAIAAALAITGGIIATCAAKGRGIVMHNIPPSIYAWCTGQ